MKSSGENASSSTRLSPRFWLLAPLLGMLCALVTGCPHNDYTVELKPNAGGMERTLTFYRADGTDANGEPNYQTFPTNELAAITDVYPVGAVQPDGKRYVAHSVFSSAMPNDVGGAGTYTNLATSLGDAGFYLERFRGNDDLAARTAEQNHAADQLTDLVIGWAQVQFGREPGWQKLHGFLDKNFRHDLKNAGQYFQLGSVISLYNTNAPEEFIARFGQYLIERGYLKPADAPALYLAFNGNDSVTLGLIRRLTLEKMEMKMSETLPQSFVVLASLEAFQKSWEDYLAQTDLYQAKLKEWQEKSKTNPQLAAPKPLDAPDDLMQQFLGWSFSLDGENDHLTVKLALQHAPHHTNGKWADGQVIWQADLGEHQNTLPAICYASWSNPNDAFQAAHFGRVLLDDDALSEYCLWHDGLDGKRVQDWDAFLAGLNPGEELKKKLEAFQFAATPDSKTAEDKQLEAGRQLLINALGNETATTPAGSK